MRAMHREDIHANGRRAVLRAAAGIAALLCAPRPGVAQQGFPSKPVTIVVPSAPGGALDITARPLARKLSESLAQQFIVDNRPGATGIIGAGAVARAAPDGHTILITSNNFTTNPALSSKLPYDPLRDFAPLSQIVLLPLVLAVHPSLPAQSVVELTAYLKSHPESVSYSSTGNGGPVNFAVEMFKQMTGTRIVHVPYKGSGPAVAALVSGEVQMSIIDLLTAAPQIKAGRLRALAVAGSRRVPSWPDLPTIAEAGVPDYEASAWLGMFAPGGTPRDVVDKLNAALVRALQSTEMREVIARSGGEPVGTSPERFAALIRDEIRKWTAIAQSNDIRLERE